MYQFLVQTECVKKCTPPTKDERVCDSSGRPYPSKCIFEKFKCFKKELKQAECPDQGEKELTPPYMGNSS